MPSRPVEDWTRGGDLYIEQAESLWSRAGGREPAVTALAHAAERYLCAALAAKSQSPAPEADLPALAAAVCDAGCEALFFGGPAVELGRLRDDAQAGFLPAETKWEHLDELKRSVARLRDVLFPRVVRTESYPGVLVCISGPSGVGKSTICRKLVEKLDAVLSVSATTRTKRENEVDGRDYHFIPRDEFEKRLERDGFLEYARVYGGNYYGTPAEPVLQALAAGRVAILEIEIQGTIQVVRRFPDTVGIYVLAPSANVQAKRLIGRREDDDAAIQERLSKADGEIRYAEECGVYRYFVVNEVLDETVERIAQIIRGHTRPNPVRMHA